MSRKISRRELFRDASAAGFAVAAASPSTAQGQPAGAPGGHDHFVRLEAGDMVATFSSAL